MGKWYYTDGEYILISFVCRSEKKERKSKNNTNTGITLINYRPIYYVTVFTTFFIIRTLYTRFYIHLFISSPFFFFLPISNKLFFSPPFYLDGYSVNNRLAFDSIAQRLFTVPLKPLYHTLLLFRVFFFFYSLARFICRSTKSIGKYPRKYRRTLSQCRGSTNYYRMRGGMTREISPRPL